MFDPNSIPDPNRDPAPSLDRDPPAQDESRAGRTPAYSLRRDLLLILALLPLLVAPTIARTELTSTDEARYTQVAREMRLADEWIAPVLNGEGYWEKPALFFDLLQIPQRITGHVSALGSRLVVLPFAMITLLCVYACGVILVDRRVGLRAAAILATSALFFEYAQYASLDMPMLAFITAAILGHVVATRTDRPKNRWRLFSAVAMGLGCHFKGPVAILLPGIVMVADSVPRHRWRALRSAHAFWMPLVALAVLALWMIPMALDQGSAYTDYAIGKHLVERSVGGGEAPHARGPFEYLPKLFTIAFPWSLLLPVLLVATVRRGFAAHPAPREESPLRFPALWALSIPLVLSCIASKRTQYLLPAVPGFALWCATWFEVRRETRLEGIATTRTVMLGLGAVAAATIAVGVVGLGIDPSPGPLTAAIPTTGRTALASGFVLLLGALTLAIAAGGAWWVRRGVAPCAFAALLVVAVGTQTIRHGLVQPWIEAFESPVAFGEEIRDEIDHGAEVAIYGLRLNGTYLLYSEEARFTPLLEPGEVVDYLGEDPSHRVIAKLRYFEKWVRPEFPGFAPEIVAETGVGRGRVVMVRGGTTLRE